MSSAQEFFTVFLSLTAVVSGIIRFRNGQFGWRAWLIFAIIAGLTVGIGTTSELTLAQSALATVAAGVIGGFLPEIASGFRNGAAAFFRRFAFPLAVLAALLVALSVYGPQKVGESIGSLIIYGILVFGAITWARSGGKKKN